MGKKKTRVIILIVIAMIAIAIVFPALLNSKNRQIEAQGKWILRVPSNVRRGSAIATIDWNKDGHIDILATDASGNVYVYLNDGNEHFVKSLEPILRVPSYILRGSAIAAIDWNKDGHIDILATGRLGDVYVYLNDGNGHFVKN